MLRGAWISYSSKGHFSVYDQHSNDIYTGNDVRAMDGKPMIKEYKIRLYDDNGYMNPTGEDDKDGSPGLTILSQGDAQGTLHTHAEEGRKVFTRGGFSNKYGSGEKGMQTDIENSRNVPGTGYFNAVATKSEVQLHNTVE